MASFTFEAGKVLTATGTSTYTPALANPSDLRPDRLNLSVLLSVTAATGTTPSLTVEVQWSNDGTTYASAATPDTFTAITAAGAVVKQFPIKGRFARLKYTVTGTTPSFTFDANAYAA